MIQAHRGPGLPERLGHVSAPQIAGEPCQVPKPVDPPRKEGDQDAGKHRGRIRGGLGPPGQGGQGGPELDSGGGTVRGQNLGHDAIHEPRGSRDAATTLAAQESDDLELRVERRGASGASLRMLTHVPFGSSGHPFVEPALQVRAIHSIPLLRSSSSQPARSSARARCRCVFTVPSLQLICDAISLTG